MAAWNTGLDRRSYQLGMAVAFCECVAAGCKQCALTDPIREVERPRLEAAIREIAAEHGLKAAYDDAEDIPLADRWCWWVLYKDPAVLEKYRALRAEGAYPARDLRPFYSLLSYELGNHQIGGTR